MDGDIPTIDLSRWIGEGANSASDVTAAAAGPDDDCRRLADALHRFGIVLVRDPRVSEVDNNAFLDQMEKYYAQSDGVKDARPEVCLRGVIDHVSEPTFLSFYCGRFGFKCKVVVSNCSWRNVFSCAGSNSDLFLFSRARCVISCV